MLQLEGGVEVEQTEREAMQLRVLAALERETRAGRLEWRQSQVNDYRASFMGREVQCVFDDGPPIWYRCDIGPWWCQYLSDADAPEHAIAMASLRDAILSIFKARSQECRDDFLAKLDAEIGFSLDKSSPQYRFAKHIEDQTRLGLRTWKVQEQPPRRSYFFGKDVDGFYQLFAGTEVGFVRRGIDIDCSQFDGLLAVAKESARVDAEPSYIVVSKEGGVYND